MLAAALMDLVQRMRKRPSIGLKDIAETLYVTSQAILRCEDWMEDNLYKFEAEEPEGVTM